MRITIINILVLLCVCFSYAKTPFTKLLRFEKNMVAKIQVGMSTDEVKKILGRPKIIASGFPQLHEDEIDYNNKPKIRKDMPEQVGQINNSTWFYYYGNIKIGLMDSGSVTYYINDTPVEDYIYDDYKDADSIWLYGGKVISKNIAKFYTGYPDTAVRIIKQFYTPRVERKKPEVVTVKFTPILCVIFDRGTQVVASSKMFFLINY